MRGSLLIEILHTIHPVKPPVLAHLRNCNHHHYLIPEHSITRERNVSCISSHSPFPSPSPMNPLLSVDLPVWGISRKWDHTLRLCTSGVSGHRVFRVHLQCSVSESAPFCVDGPHCVYLFTLGLFSLFGCCESCSQFLCEPLFINLGVEIWQ